MFSPPVGAELGCEVGCAGAAECWHDALWARSVRPHLLLKRLLPVPKQTLRLVPQLCITKEPGAADGMVNVHLIQTVLSNCLLVNEQREFVALSLNRSCRAGGFCVQCWLGWIFSVRTPV